MSEPADAVRCSPMQGTQHHYIHAIAPEQVIPRHESPRRLVLTVDCFTSAWCNVGMILRTRTGRRMDRAGASHALTRVCTSRTATRSARRASRRTFCTTGLVAGTSIRDMQCAMRHADPRTTMRYDMAKANLDRHAAHAVAAYLAGMSTG